MNVATRRPLSAADLNFNPARFPLGRLADFAREHWGSRASSRRYTIVGEVRSHSAEEQFDDLTP